MKMVKGLKDKLVGLIGAVNRYPLTMIFLLAMATVNINMINHESETQLNYLFTFLVGALLSVVAQQLFERFFTKVSERLLLMGGAVILTAGYYLAIRSAETFNMEIGTKTGVTIFALLMAFVWVPSIRSRIAFHESFMSAFKAFFITVLFTAVISAGLSAIIFAVDELLFSLDHRTNAHVWNIVYSLFAPIFFLSFTPRYPGKRIEETGDEDKIRKAVSTPKTLGILISYIIIPLTAIYTIILLVYVLLNISGKFWINNLLEPMLVSYAITVILVYLLASTVENPFTRMFRKIFPKILVPIVLFQTVASILRISEVGLTHGRYYAIMFGVFAVIAGLIFSFLPIRKNGWIAAVLIVFSAISIIPPVDAFTVSRVNQTNLLKETLVKNNMLEKGELVPNPEISTEDKKLITRTIGYLNSMDYTKNIDWLPDKIDHYGNFKKTFGFEEVYDQPEDGGDDSRFAHLDWERSTSVNIESYQAMVHVYFDGAETQDINKPVEINGKPYKVKEQREGKNFYLNLIDEKNDVIIRYDLKKAFDQILSNQKAVEGESAGLTVEKATATQENEAVRMSILANNIDYYDGKYNGDFFVFIQVKG